MAENVVIELGREEAKRPTDQPGRGDRRVVKIVPTPFGKFAPIIWRSEYPATGVDNPEGIFRKGRTCVLLVDKGGPTTEGGTMPPTTLVTFISDETWEKLPEDVVEW